MSRRSHRLQTTASRSRSSWPKSPGRRATSSSATARAGPSGGAPVSASRTARKTAYRPTSRFMCSTVTARWRRSSSPLSQAIRLDLPAPSSPENEISMPGSPREALLAQPELEGEHGEDALVEATPAHGSAGAPQPVTEPGEPAADERAVEHGTRASVAGKQQVLERAVETARHHHIERDAEAPFRARGDGAREPALCQGPQHALARAGPGLESVRQRDAERDDVLVEHGHPHFDAGPHAHHVDFAQHVRRQADGEAALREAPGQLVEIRGTSGGGAGRVEVAVHGREPRAALRPDELFLLRLAQVVAESREDDGGVGPSRAGELNGLRRPPPPSPRPRRGPAARLLGESQQPIRRAHEQRKQARPPEFLVAAERFVAAVAREGADD